jgi:exodeoxyribonuclease VIII
MLDLETLSTEPNAMIVSIGAAEFNNNGVVNSFYEIVNLKDQAGRHVDPSTVTWWMKQSEAARAVFGQPTSPLDHALDRFTRFCLSNIDDIKLVEMWGNGSEFDNVLLSDLYAFNNAKFADEGKIRRPWLYYNNRCFRTLKNLFPAMYKEISEKTERKVFHNAEDDASWQAEVAAKILHIVELPRSSW